MKHLDMDWLLKLIVMLADLAATELVKFVIIGKTVAAKIKVAAATFIITFAAVVATFIATFVAVITAFIAVVTAFAAVATAFAEELMLAEAMSSQIRIGSIFNYRHSINLLAF